jgi:hypothetical protein
VPFYAAEVVLGIDEMGGMAESAAATPEHGGAVGPILTSAHREVPLSLGSALRRSPESFPVGSPTCHRIFPLTWMFASMRGVEGH